MPCTDDALSLCWLDVRPRVRFWLYGPLLPLLVVQGRWTRARAPKLPEAEGPFHGVVGESLGDSMSLAVVGESTAAGVGVLRQDDALAFCVARSLSRVRQRAVRVQVVGRHGANLRQTREALLPQLDLPCDTVLVVTGVNDTLELTNGRTWSAELRAVVRELTSRGARHVVFSSIPPLGAIPVLPQPTRSALGARAEYLDRIMRETCAATGAHHVPIRFEPQADLLAADGFHPSATGYAAWADSLVASWPVTG